MISFTICSNNYLGKARVLASSLKAVSETPVFLFLADLMEQKIDYAVLGFDRVITADELGIANLQWMKENYSIVEFNTAIKPFAFSYLFKHTDTVSVYYFDPDMRVYQPLTAFEKWWKGSDILLTPHILTPIPLDGKFPEENLFLNHGTYNLGFLGLKRSANADALLSWWSERMLTHCRIQLAEGYFTDQIWFNLVPGFFNSVTVVDQPGWNMAYWNLHERRLSQEEGQFVVNGNTMLFFYHFSGFDPSLTKLHYLPDYRFSFDDQPVLLTLYRGYLEELNKYDPDQYKSFAYFHGRYPLPVPVPSFGERVLRKIRSKLR